MRKTLQTRSCTLSTAIALLPILSLSAQTLPSHLECACRPYTAALADSRPVILRPEGAASWWIAPDYPERVLELADLSSCAFDIPSAWTGILGLLDFLNPAYPERDNHRVPPVFGPPAGWPHYNPMNSIATLRGKAPRFATGTAAFDHRMNLAFHIELDELSIPHEFDTLPGGHIYTRVAEAPPRAHAFHVRASGGPHAR